MYYSLISLILFLAKRIAIFHLLNKNRKIYDQNLNLGRTDTETDYFNYFNYSDLSEKLQKLKPYGAADRMSPSEKAEERSKLPQLFKYTENSETRQIKDG
jgi:hypothetical protein